MSGVAIFVKVNFVFNLINAYGWFYIYRTWKIGMPVKVAVFWLFYLYYDLGPVVIRLRFAAPRQEPRDDIENKNTARLGGGGYRCL